MGQYIVYVTFENQQQADDIAKSVVKERLAACANILPAHKSVYWWNGNLETAQECATIFKTTTKQVNALKDKIVELHSYDVPCVVAWPIERGNESFLRWIEEETKTG